MRCSEWLLKGVVSGVGWGAVRCESVCTGMVGADRRTAQGLIVTPRPLGAHRTHDYKLCEDCGKLKDKGNFCPICEVLYRDDDYDSKMMLCDDCEGWFHIACVDIDEDTYEQLSTSCVDVPFSCPQCKPSEEQTVTDQIENFKDQLARKQREIEAKAAARQMHANMQNLFQRCKKVCPQHSTLAMLTLPCASPATMRWFCGGVRVLGRTVAAYPTLEIRKRPVCMF